MKRRIALLAAFAAVATACGDAQSDEVGAPAASCKPALVRVTVMNGDTHKPVRGARGPAANRPVQSTAQTKT